ncbi:pentapeptide repeat-containing protein [Nanoarchaeota archaeon]
MGENKEAQGPYCLLEGRKPIPYKKGAIEGSIELGRQQGKIDFERAYLVGANLTHANLTDADLTDADLTDADLTRAYLTRAYLTRADLTHANLTDADLTDADLTDADLTRAYLTRAYLTRADLTHANLTDADLTHANLTDADLTHANLTDADLTRAYLTRANLWDAKDLEKVSLGESKGVYYFQQTPIGSRGDVLTCILRPMEGREALEDRIYCFTGCSKLTMRKMRDRVEEVHRGTPHEKDYITALNYAKGRLAEQERRASQ